MAIGPPFNRRFPNWDAVAEDGFPLLCTILFGFLGAYFGAVAVAPPDAEALKHDFVVWTVSFGAKNAILIASGAGSTAFFVSALLAMYAKMFSVTSAPANNEEQVIAGEFARTREKFLFYSSIAFNIGAIITPVSGFLLISAPAIWIVLALYGLLLAFVARYLR